jgi:predicted acetyltransferase
MGWALANDSYELACPPSALPDHDTDGSFRPMDADDWERFRPVEAATGEGVTLSMRRSEAWWRERTLTNWTGGTEPFVYGYERDGSVAGYLVYTVSDDDGHERTLSVDAFGYADREAHRSLLAFLGRHGPQIDRVELTYPTHTRPLDTVADPKAVTCERVPGPMARLTGLDPLSDVDWSVLDGPMTLAVSDPLLDATDGLVRVTEDGLERTTEGTADAETDIGTLTQLYLGRYDPATAERFGGLDIEDDSARDALATVFPERPVCLREFF